jgi:glucose/arabinose dehydrogenase
MKIHRVWRAFIAAWLCALAVFAEEATAPSAFRDGDRVLFIGDTGLEREVDFGDIETDLTAALAGRGVTFRNLAWAGDTPMGRARASFDWNRNPDDWLKRVQEQVALVKPTVAFLSYAMTASLENGPSGIEAFTRDLNRLMDAITATSGGPVRFVVLGPVKHEAGFGSAAEISEHNAALRQYRDALRQVAAARAARFVDLLDLEAPHGVSLTSNGVILNETGHRVAAAKISRELLGAGVADKPAASPEWQILNAAIRKKNELFFHRWRPANWTYLFGFRKHEQGQNAAEIPKFDALISLWDGRIARLCPLTRQDPATVAEVRSLTSDRPAAPRSAITAQPIPTFTVADGFEVSLWAENPDLFKPIQMNWDPQGRLWIASSRTYPQVAPGQDAADSVIVLEDTDGDGRADKSTSFADRLLIPTGVVPDGRGGCYVAASHQLLHLADTNHDGRADVRTIVLSSFGTEDTHHNLHTLRWGYDGHLYMNQSIYTHTHIETPHGVRRLNSGGIWRFHPESWDLEVLSRGGCNPWGHHWDAHGNHFFTDGAGFKGLYHAMEGATYFTYSDMRREAESISPGNYPKFASLEIVNSPAFPDDWQGQLVTCDFRAHRIVRFGLTDSGSSFQTREQPDLLRSTNVTFRPIDLRFGPDGALYVADWSNPIIQHGEVDFRDPRRDHEHGRIWRITARGAKPSQVPRDLAALGRQRSLDALLDLTLTRHGWAQEQARVVLRQSAPDDVLPALNAWLGRQKDPRARLEALWLHEAFKRPASALIDGLAAASDPRLRTAAARQLAK